MIDWFGLSQFKLESNALDDEKLPFWALSKKVYAVEPGLNLN